MKKKLNADMRKLLEWREELKTFDWKSFRRADWNEKQRNKARDKAREIKKQKKI